MAIRTEQDKLYIVDGEYEAVFSNTNGKLLSVKKGTASFACDGLDFDLGIDEKMLNGLVEHDPLDDKRTWELPITMPTGKRSDDEGFTGWSCDRNRATARYEKDGFFAALTWEWHLKTLAVSLTAHNISKKTVDVTGALFALRLPIPAGCKELESEFPGNIPHNLFDVRKLKELEVVQTGLVNAVTHHRFDDNNLNVVFLDEEEKWGTSIYRTADNMLTNIYYPAVEIRLAPGQGFSVGTLRIQPVGSDNPWLAVRNLYNDLGYKVPDNGIREGVLYSCHPHGTMDSGFQDRFTMREYAEELPRLREIGIDHVWLLPIFDHGDRGVYHPTDQAVIDPKYGTDEDVRYYSDKAHELDMTVLYDYVPHGPEPSDPLAKEHDDWCSRRRDQSLQNEWNCVSFDMTNQRYLDYHFDLVADHIRRFDIDGSRIDCAMGGLSNWRPYPGRRPSSANLRGGVNISQIIRDAFIHMKKKPLILPENFNPLPQYYPATDLFYDMPLYRALSEMIEYDLEPAEYVQTVTRWLERENWMTPERLLKLRFLGNHDTVSWVITKARATRTYGEDKAKALWTLLSFIDGIPMLYQGDEDPKICHQEDLPVLKDFFRELFAARGKYLTNDFSTRYLHTGTSVMAFVRNMEDKQRLVLVNFSGQEIDIKPEMLEGVDIAKAGDVVYGGADVSEGVVKMPAWGSVMFSRG